MKKLYYVVVEHYVHTESLTSRLTDYEIKCAYENWHDAANYVNDIYQNHNRRNDWKAIAGGVDGIPVYSIKKMDECSSTRMFVKE